MRQIPDVIALLNAVHANPLPLDEVIARLGTALRLHLEYLASRERRHIHTSTDAMMEQELEALASAIHLLQHQDLEVNIWKTRYSELLRLHHERSRAEQDQPDLTSLAVGDLVEYRQPASKKIVGGIFQRWHDEEPQRIIVWSYWTHAMVSVAPQSITAIIKKEASEEHHQ